jgi:hypothetical protein
MDALLVLHEPRKLKLQASLLKRVCKLSMAGRLVAS